MIPNAYDGRACPATAQFAIQQARQLSDNLERVLSDAQTKPFYFRPPGMFAAIGHHNAVATIYGIKLSGFLAWFLWRGIYLAKLPTLNRKLEVAINWALQHSISAQHCSASPVAKAVAAHRRRTSRIQFTE